MTEATFEVVPALRDYIEQRMDELGLDPTGLADATGLSLTVLAQVRKGYRKKYQKRLTMPLCDALGWTRDSIGLILAGGEPKVMQPDDAARGRTDKSLREIGETIARLQDLTDQRAQRSADDDRRLAELERRSAADDQRLADLERRVAALEQGPTPPGKRPVR